MSGGWWRRLTAPIGAVAVIGALLGAPTADAAGSGVTVSRAPTTTPTAAAARALPDLDNFRTRPGYRRYFAQRVRWSAATCPDAGELAALIQCARIRVPRDWYHPRKGDITVAISRMAGQPRRPRLLLTNPGGPGAEGLFFGVVAGLFLGVGETHTAIGMDPRGVGASTRLTCPREVLRGTRSHRADGDSRTWSQTQVRADAGVLARYVRTCRAAAGSLLPYIDSDQTARDLDLVRHLLGYRTADYYGVSYGTWLGALLEKMFPNRMARVVLDANTDWASGSFDRVFASQAESFQAQFDRVFLPWLGRHDDVFHLGDSASAVNATYERLRAALARRALGAAIGPDLLDRYLIASQYDPSGWDETGVFLGRLDAALAGNAAAAAEVRRTLLAVARPDLTADAVFTAVRCNDVAAERSWSRWLATAGPRARTYPLVGPSDLTTICAGWPYRPALSRAVMARPVRGVLMLQTEADPATGYAGALATRRRANGQVRMVVVDDAPGHGAGLLVSLCATRRVVAYLGEGRYPSGDVACPATPIQAGQVRDDRVYEFFGQATPARPLPAAVRYPVRDLSEPAADQLAPQAPPASPAPLTPLTPAPGDPGTLAVPDPSSNPWAEEFARLIRQAQHPSTPRDHAEIHMDFCMITRV